MSNNGKTLDPIFNRGDIAKILNVTPLTIRNRENSKKYPEPGRDLNNYRIYTLSDVFNLQIITYGKIDTNPIISILYDKGYHSIKEVSRIIDKALSKRMAGNANGG